MKTKYTLFFLILLFICNCQKERNQLYPDELGKYVDEFFLQANLRGMKMNVEDYDFEIKFKPIEDYKILGSCNPWNSSIKLDPDKWERLDEQKREWLVFHELGHCLLQRPHRNIKTAEEECLSFMKGIENDFDCSFNRYSAYWRKYYLDELFLPNHPLPDWFFSNRLYDNEFTENEYTIEILDTLATEIIIDTIPFDQYDTFLLEFEFSNWQTEESLVQVYFGNLIFKSCNTCTVGKVEIVKSGGKNFYSRKDLSFTSDIKLTIIRKQDVVSFFVNEIFVHTMEYDLITGNFVKSLRFDELMEMDVRVLL